ncbi:DUF2256 domain-containing protein [Aestuariibacter halophilus]|uniref:DUF2256 domain-containing protein n=1 Tax=Fluctibacter halophilus TaxID=226011 RepID=A0ABS8G7R4_9ALTE|nr:DUF2256 domain-containing protein [Aestuariibacter halophilus]MCC2616573.1 DUF2256 domain-containing protein [Aestuariibacter halophilus]
MPPGVKKQHLPEKTCPVCQRPFRWRKKWADHWEAVKYCSRRCAGNRSSLPNQGH